MNMIRTVMEPWDAAQVTVSLEASLNTMENALRAITKQLDGQEILSTPVHGMIFFLRDDSLVCLPSDYIHQGFVDNDSTSDACSVEDLDLSVSIQRDLIEAIDEWVSRPVYTVSRTQLSAA